VVESINIRISSYENVIADCPCCDHVCIFNRASDLHTFEPIGGRNVRCTDYNCRKPFRIISDSVNERHEMLVYECYELKQYMYCILNLATAYEMFFGLFLRANLLYKPFAQDPNPDNLNQMNCLSVKLNSKIKKYTFSPMRQLFLSEVTNKTPITDLLIAEERILSLSPQETPVSRIEALDDKDLVQLLRALKNTEVYRVRNNVVHKQAYRPTKEEAAKYFEEAKFILFQLTRRLDIRDEIN